MIKKHSLIIGGTKGIGRSLVKLLASKDSVVSIIGRNPPMKADLGTSVSYWAVDLLDQKKLTETLSEIIKQNGKLNYLVFFQRYRGENENWTGEIDTSLTATKFAIGQLKNQFYSQEAAIVLVSSVNAHLISEHLPLAYHVAKAGLVQMARYYAVKLGPKNVRVNSVSLGTILKEESKEILLKDKKLKNFYQHLAPLRRMGIASEAAEAIAFLCSSKASFITGQNLVVDGGLSILWPEVLSIQSKNSLED